MDDSAITVKSECFKNNLISSLQRLRYNGKFCDITIKCADSELKAHKHILASATEYFEAMFSSDTNEAHTGVVDFSHFRTDTVKQCLDFVYSGKVEISAKAVKDMLNLSAMIQLYELARLCMELLAERINLENCSEIIVLSNLHCKESLSLKIGMFLTKRFDEYIKTDDFKDLRCDCLLHCMELLESAVTGRVCEMHKWNGILSWVSYDPAQRKDKFLKLFKTIRLSSFSKKFLKENVLSQPLVNESTECLMLTAIRDETDEPYPTPKNTTLENPISKILYFDGESQMIVQYEVNSGIWLPAIPFPEKLTRNVHVISHNGCIYVGNGRRIYQLCRGRWNVTNACSDCSRFCRCIGIGNRVFMVTSAYMYECTTYKCKDGYALDSELNSYSLQQSIRSTFFITASDRGQIFIIDILSTAFMFDLSTKICVRVKDMPSPCPNGLAVWYDSRVFTFCKNWKASSACLYEPKIDSWAIVPNVAISSVPKSFYYIGNKLYLTGESPDDICAQVDLDYLKSIQAEMDGSGMRYVAVTS